MAISVVCPGCGKVLKAADRLAGRTAPCPACRHPVHIPHGDVDPEATAYELLSGGDDDVQPPGPPLRPSALDKPVEARPQPEIVRRPPSARPSISKPPAPPSLPPLSANETPAWLKHLHWVLALAMIPLAVSLLNPGANRDDIIDRLDTTIDTAPPQAKVRIYAKIAEAEKGQASLHEVLEELPGQKIIGALLPVNSWVHWAFALVSVALFMGFCMLLAADKSAEPLHMLLVGLFTATVGILLLLLVQWAADATRGVWVVGCGVVTIIFLIIKMIGYSYDAAVDPENGFVLSFIGFTVGVGFLEETCKLLPVLVRFRQPNDYSWRNAFLWGLASGAGFGIAEGIRYSGSFYNGISGGETYVVRFVSCVALHALWTGSAAIMLHQNQHLLHREMRWFEYVVPVIVYVGIPMVLHGLYDTFLKKEINSGALVVAALSFGLLAVQIYWLRGTDDAAANDAMLREYKRRRAMQ